ILLAPEGIFWRVRDLARRGTAPAGKMPGEEDDSPGTAGGPPASSSTDGRDARGPSAGLAAAPSPGQVILSVRNLSKSFGGLKAVQDVGFDVTQGAILGIIGPNGAGKTTLFNLLNGFQKPDAGEILLDGRNVVGRKPHQLCGAGIGRTFQIM